MCLNFQVFPFIFAVFSTLRLYNSILCSKKGYCKVLESCWGSDPGSNLGKLPESGGNQGEVPVSGLSGEFGSTCVVEGPNTWEATDGHGPGAVRVGWRMRIEGLVT